MQQPSPWANAFRGFEDWDDDRKRARVTELLTAAGGLMQQAKIVQKPNDDEIQLRGLYAGYPTRVVADAFWDLAVDMKAPAAQLTTLTVLFDPGSAPSAGDVDPWDESDDVRVFLAKCVYVETSASEIDATLRKLQSLPAEFRGHLYYLMQTNALSAVNLTADGPGSSFRNDVGEMWDPMTQLSQVLWLVGYAANVYRALPPESPGMQGYGAAAGHAPGAPGYAPTAAAAAIPVTRVQCKYCSTIYLWGPQPACPNCGAPYTG